MWGWGRGRPGWLWTQTAVPVSRVTDQSSWHLGFLPLPPTPLSPLGPVDTTVNKVTPSSSSPWKPVSSWLESKLALTWGHCFINVLSSGWRSHSCPQVPPRQTVPTYVEFPCPASHPHLLSPHTDVGPLMPSPLTTTITIAFVLPGCLTQGFLLHSKDGHRRDFSVYKGLLSNHPALAWHSLPSYFSHSHWWPYPGFCHLKRFHLWKPYLPHPLSHHSFWSAHFLNFFTPSLQVVTKPHQFLFCFPNISPVGLLLFIPTALALVLSLSIFLCINSA